MKIDAGKIPRIETDIKIGEALKIGDRTLHFLARISILRTEDGEIIGGWAYPLAMIANEQGNNYAFSFTGEDFTMDQLMKMAPSLRDVLDKDKGVYRIKIR